MKMWKNLFLYSLVFVALSFNSKAQNTNDIPIGAWRDHVSYYLTHNVCRVENRILVACQSALFYYDPKTKEMEKLSKVNGLSDAGLGVTAYDSITKNLVITYENSNIDIVQNGEVYNISDIKTRSIEGSKSINSICFDNNKAYLACGFGVVVLDLDRKEIKDTWYVGHNSSAIRVNEVYINDTSIFLSTVEGLLYANKNTPTLAWSENWSVKPMNYSIGHREVNFCLPLNSRELLVNVKDSLSTNSTLLKYNGQNDIIDTLLSDVFIDRLFCSNGKICMINYMGFSVFDTNFNQIYHYSDTWNPIYGMEVDIKDLCVEQDNLWLAHRYKGLVRIPLNENVEFGREEIVPSGPMTDNVFSITPTQEGIIYVAPGGKDQMGINRFVQADAYKFNGWYWDHLQYAPTINKDSIFDVLNITLDPKDPKHMMLSSWWNGVFEVYNDTIIRILDSTNTNHSIDKYPYNYRIASAQYDISGNLIIANSLVNKGLAFLNYHGQWGAFNTSSFLNDDELAGLCLDNVFHYMLLFTKTNKILLIDGNGQMRFIDPNNGSMVSTNNINCITQDKDGEIWIGTEKGVKVIYSLYDALGNNSSMQSSLQCNNIVYAENGIAQYLLSFENILCIAIDGANRKWIGTERNGIYVLDASGSKEIYHFTLENSPLLSNKVVALAQNPLTGEVFIGTDRGLCSYRAESMPEFTDNKEELIVYPNPVRPDYEGQIAIKGFKKDNTDVKITDSNGKEVMHLKSLGGQAIFDGRDFNGRKLSTGVYYIFSYSEGGENKSVGKFLIVK